MLLPAELKNEIYALALIHPNGVYLVSKTKRYRYTVQMQPTRSPNTTIATLSALTPNILLLNRAIHAETQPILYGGNTFALEDTKTLHAFLANIGHKNCATLTDITLLGWGTTRTQTALNYPAFTLLVDAVKLQHLHLDCRIDWGGAKSVAKQLYRNGIHWLEAVGVAKGRFDAAIEVIEISDCNFPDYKYSRAAGDIPSPEERIEEFRAVLRKMLH